ncbi:hypothetical protein B0H14DRAFT_3457471 [Mycena olivaceomarginata]|nr:hypothetical protein B0H14DRAFT_3457471 [Mycena olivaceomarginata]
MQPKLSEATHGFDFGRSRPVIRDVVRWINLADESPNTPWFYEQCLVTSSSKSKDKGRIFKCPKTSFAVALVLSAGQWEEYLAYHASIDLDECLLQELLGSEEAPGTQFFACDPANALQGSIVVDPKNTGTSSNRAVVRFAPADEYARAVQEANLLYWAASLMELTYSFIHCFLSKSSADPPFEILQLRFVHAGVAEDYLVEEFINESSEGFVKFVHNGDANPLLDLDDPLYEIAEFLCFTQHVQ